MEAVDSSETDTLRKYLYGNDGVVEDCPTGCVVGNVIIATIPVARAAGILGLGEIQACRDRSIRVRARDSQAASGAS